MNKEKIQLTDEKFQEIYISEKFRNEVAFAHGYHNSNGEFVHKQTCSYPITYIVTDSQIKEAEKERQRAKKEAYKKYKNVLLFAGMGMTYTKEEHNDDILNHRIRTEFLNQNREQFFVEFGTMPDNETIHCQFSIDRGMQKGLEEKGDYKSQPYYNYKGLERNQYLGKYTKENILKLINKTFNCSFTELIVDNYNISCDGVICESPQSAGNYGTDWANVDLERATERELKILEPYSFDTLLLEISCNLQEITEETVLKQARATIKGKIADMEQVLKDNLANVTKYAQGERAIK